MSNARSRRSFLLLAGASSFVAACGGGGGGGGYSSGGGAVASSSSSSSVSMPALPDPSTAPALKTQFAANFKFGLVADDWITGDASISALVIKHASSMTAESVMKANPIGVSAGVYSYAAADRLATFTQTNGIALRGPVLGAAGAGPEVPGPVHPVQGAQQRQGRYVVGDVRRPFLAEYIPHNPDELPAAFRPFG